MGISNLPLAYQSNLCHIIWIWKNTPIISPTIKSFFQGLGMILVMKKNSINQKSYIEMFTTSILKFLKKQNTCKNITPTFKYLIVFWNFHKF
jgi:hypothetical protein